MSIGQELSADADTHNLIHAFSTIDTRKGFTIPLHRMLANSGNHGAVDRTRMSVVLVFVVSIAMSPFRRIFSTSVALALCASMAAPVLAASPSAVRRSLFFAPPAGMTFTKGRSTNALMLHNKYGIHPQFLRQVVPYETRQRVGTIVINTGDRFLYLVLPKGRAMRYGIGIARTGFEWSGTHKLTAKRKWPSWTPPAEMLQRQPELPRHMKGGPNNPLGARGLYIGSTLYRIHGTNQPWTIGQKVSSGCIRLTNDDVSDLYIRVKIGAKVVVL